SYPPPRTRRLSFLKLARDLTSSVRISRVQRVRNDKRRVLGGGYDLGCLIDFGTGHQDQLPYPVCETAVQDVEHASDSNVEHHLRFFIEKARSVDVGEVHHR